MQNAGGTPPVGTPTTIAPDSAHHAAARVAVGGVPVDGERFPDGDRHVSHADSGLTAANAVIGEIVWRIRVRTVAHRGRVVRVRRRSRRVPIRRSGARGERAKVAAVPASASPVRGRSGVRARRRAARSRALRVTSATSVPRRDGGSLPRRRLATASCRAPRGSGRSEPRRPRSHEGTLPAGRHVVSATATSTGEKFAAGCRSPTAHPPATLLPGGRQGRWWTLSCPQPQVAYQGRLHNVAPCCSSSASRDDAVPELLASGRPVAVWRGGGGAARTPPRALVANAAAREYARNGGTVVMQYGQQEMQTLGILPYPSR